MTPNLAALEGKIASVLALKPQCFITHPSELHRIRSMTLDELRAFAERPRLACGPYGLAAGRSNFTTT